MPFHPCLVVPAWEFTTFAAVADLLFVAAKSKIPAAAATAPKAVVGYIPAALAQRGFFHHRIGAAAFPDPSLASKPRNQRFGRFPILFHCYLVLAARGAVDSAGRQPWL